MSHHQSEVPQGLLQKIMTRIKAEQRMRMIRRRVLAFGTLFLSMVALFVSAFQSFITDITETGFADYAQLAYIDFRLVVANWYDFSMSLLESLPIISTITLLAMVSLLIVTFKMVLHYAKALYENTAHGALLRA